MGNIDAKILPVLGIELDHATKLRGSHAAAEQVSARGPAAHHARNKTGARSARFLGVIQYAGINGISPVFLVHYKYLGYHAILSDSAVLHGRSGRVGCRGNCNVYDVEGGD